jgi:hypothetical protein
LEEKVAKKVQNAELNRVAISWDIEIVGVSETAMYGNDLKGESVFLKKLSIKRTPAFRFTMSKPRAHGLTS